MRSVFDSDFSDLDLNLTTALGCPSGFGITYQLVLSVMMSALLCFLDICEVYRINHDSIFSYTATLCFHQGSGCFWSLSPFPTGAPSFPGGNPYTSVPPQDLFIQLQVV